MKSKIKPMILIGAVAILLLGGTWFFLSQSTSKKEPKELSADEIVARMVETEPMTTNLHAGGFIQLGFKIETSSEKAKEELTNRLFQVNNIAIRLISAMTEEQVKSPEGMTEFEKNMQTELNKEMQTGKIVRIYTTNKMIQ
ncbi:flagellar basal body-associated FliL family protein [Bacillus sp. ISL-18]|uniref:flagellar basal body-associated FliL family protein n=1 Tax=Bacillus sp. ISL-18 TaxID=2819118 RepID=UPI001BEABA0F|nr:flagellar basal body-associated FliL family protein [Bacillus sp. ISL-18]MBT2657796.1 flagellar basal body-associated FliL family protein [Bacillus sp. ISL-18]